VRQTVAEIESPKSPLLAEAQTSIEAVASVLREEFLWRLHEGRSLFGFE
jgi:hypothetical protein